MVRIPTHRLPTHPGEMLLEEFLKPLELTQRDLADAIHGVYSVHFSTNLSGVRISMD
jgi:plasmid maintenance system antidote protein VapI